MMNRSATERNPGTFSSPSAVSALAWTGNRLRPATGEANRRPEVQEACLGRYRSIVDDSVVCRLLIFNFF
jgi:hypothetical protein